MITLYRKILLIVLLVSCNILLAQEVKTVEPKDSLRTENPGANLSNEMLQPKMENNISAPDLELDRFTSADESAPEINPKAIELPPLASPWLATWQGGAMTGYHGSMENLFSYRNIAGITAMQSWNNLLLSSDVYLSKGIANGVGIVNSTGVNLQLAYIVSRNVSLHAFGGMSHSGFMGPAPNVTTGYYGGYVTLNTNNQKWGMDLGVRRVYNAMTGRWETIPIAMPYYNLGGSKLGFDFGGLIYSLFYNAAENLNKRKEKYDPSQGPMIIIPPMEFTTHFDPIETPNWVEKQYPNQY